MAFLRDSSKIKVRMFFEVMGWPPEALVNHLKKVLESLKKNWKILKEEYAEPEKIGEKMYTSHVEFEAEIPSFSSLVQFCLAYAPSVVEILEPSEIYLTAGEIQDIVADINAKVQEMDKQIKMLAAQAKKMGTILKKTGILKEKKPVERVVISDENELPSKGD